jgi:hypothetical protein
VAAAKAGALPARSTAPTRAAGNPLRLGPQTHGHRPHDLRSRTPRTSRPFRRSASRHGPRGHHQGRARRRARPVHILPDGMDDRAVPLDAGARERILAANDEMTQRCAAGPGCGLPGGFGVAGEINAKELERDLVFVGLIGMIDPARAEVKPALQKARGRHPHHYDHRRLSQHCPSHCGKHRLCCTPNIRC